MRVEGNQYRLKSTTESRPKKAAFTSAWWLTAGEFSNPKVAKPYNPWWLENNFLVNDSWKLPDLKREAKRRKLLTKGTKDELILRINESYHTYKLTDDNFTSPKFSSFDNQAIQSCYPQVYEKE
jgi:hypothetical protein